MKTIFISYLILISVLFIKNHSPSVYSDLIASYQWALNVIPWNVIWGIIIFGIIAFLGNAIYKWLDNR